MQNPQQTLLPEVLAKIQCFQDSLSKSNEVTIFICDSNGEDFTVPSGRTDFCGKNMSQSKEVCEKYIRRACLEADKRGSTLFSMCPFGSWVAIAPLECLVRHELSGKTRYFLVLIHAGKKLWGQDNSDDSDLKGFRASAEMAANCMDIIFSLMNEAKLLPEPQVGIKRENFERLTEREKEIVRLVSNGMSNQEIADQLVISEHTVKTHISNILKKLELNNRTKIALYEIQQI